MSPGEGSPWWKVMALAMGLPSLIVGTFFGLYVLVQKNIIGWVTLLIVLLLVIGNTFFFMVRYGLVGKNRK
ncbi:MAG: hypothetical protein K2P81_04065 [Bacteriovoracaceae bacterium]|nr:hypothetical protein [Bacteriovoracaceae bacterium]